MSNKFNQFFELNYETLLIGEANQLVVPFEKKATEGTEVPFNSEIESQTSVEQPDDDGTWITIRKVKNIKREITRGKRHRELIDQDTSRYIYGNKYDVVKIYDEDGKMYRMKKPYLNQNTAYNDSLIGKTCRVKLADKANPESKIVDIQDIRI